MRNWFAATLGVVLMAAGASAASAQVADTVLVNGKILTVDQQFSTRSAVAVREGRILAVGSDADIRKLAGPTTRTIDLQGRTVIPGLIDSHMHATRAALELQHRSELDWRGVAGGGAEPPSRGGAEGQAWCMADRRDAAGHARYVQGAASADAGRARCRRAEQSRVRAARLRVGDDDAARAEGAEHQRPTPTCRRATRSNATRRASRPERSPATWSSCSTACPSRRSRSRSRARSSFSASSIAWA